jgi:hypothetical protein
MVSGVQRGTGVVVHGGTMTAGMAAKGRRRKKGRYRGGGSFYSRRRQLAKAVRDVARAVVAVKLGAAERRRPQSKRGRHGQRRCSDRAADGWPSGFEFFQFIQN